MSVIVHLRSTASIGMTLGPTVRQVEIPRGASFVTTYTEQGDLYVFDDKSEPIQAFAPGAWESVEIKPEDIAPKTITVGSLRADVFTSGTLPGVTVSGDANRFVTADGAPIPLVEPIAEEALSIKAERITGLADLIATEIEKVLGKTEILETVEGFRVYDPASGPTITINNFGAAVKSDDNPE